jgi:hypothetical protein
MLHVETIDYVLVTCLIVQKYCTAQCDVLHSFNPGGNYTYHPD